MNKQQRLQNIWAMTDKAALDMMMKKTHQPPHLSPSIANDSTDENSDSESLDSSYGSFVAVPKEFRPPPSACTKIEHFKICQSDNKQDLSKQNPIKDSKSDSQKTLPKVTFLQCPKPALIEHEKSFNQNKIPDMTKNENSSKLQKIHKVANDTMTAQNKTDMKTNSGAKGKTPLQPPKKIADNSFQKQDALLSKKDPKYEKEKNIKRYNHVEKQEHKTVKLNFEMPPKPNPFRKDELKIDPIKKENLKQQKKANQNFFNGVEHFCKDTHTASYQEGIIKWDNSLNLREPNSNTDKFEQDFGINAHKYSYEENRVKWDSSLNLDKQSKDTDKFKQHSGIYADKYSYKENMVKWDSSLNLDKQSSDTKGKTEQNFGNDIPGVSYKTHTIKWHSSLNVEELSSDTEGEIEWTIIQENKTTVSAKTVQNKNYVHKQINKECPPTKPCTSKKFRKWHHKKKFNNNYLKQPNINHSKYTPRSDPSDCKYTQKVQNKNNFQLNSNLKCDNIEIRNSKTQKERSLDAETFTQRCRVSEKNVDSQSNQSLSNVKSEFTVNSNTRKDTDSWKSNSYPEKIDNATLKHIEDQKKSMLHFGREIADLIIGSHTALSVFISIFNEWKRLRLELINHFKYLENNLKESSKQFIKYRDLLSFVKTGAVLAAAVPIPHVSIAAKVINVLTGLFSAFLTKTGTKNAEIDDSNDIILAVSKDTHAATEVYTYGLQCAMQFEETAKLIEEFHSNAGDPVIFESDSPEIANFIRGVMEYRPRHRIFYKKLHKCFQELLCNSTSEFGKRFCEPFLLYSSEAIDVVGLLDWRFRHEEFNGESVRFELREIERLIESNDISVKELVTRVQNCIRFMEDELKFLEGCMKDITLFGSSIQHGVKAF